MRQFQEVNRIERSTVLSLRIKEQVDSTFVIKQIGLLDLIGFICGITLCKDQLICQIV